MTGMASKVAVDGLDVAFPQGNALRACLFALISASLVTAASATAAPQKLERDTGSNSPEAPRARIPNGAGKDPTIARKVVADFARCVVDRNAKEIHRAFSLPPGRNYWRTMSVIATNQCLAEGQMSIPQSVMRGAIFAELFRRFTRDSVRLVAVAPIDFSQAVEKDDQPGRTQRAKMQLAACIVRTDRMNSTAVVLEPTGSSTQEAAFKALAPSIGPCVSEGEQMTISKSILEGILAEVLYRGTLALPSQTELK